jgi:pimeloyl-ACP methyl ester carboxylesterase
MSLHTALRSQTIETGRLKTHFIACGASGGIPVIFVHGNLASCRFFDETLLALPDGYYGVALDLRGFGESEAKPVDATRGLRDFSDDVRDLMEELGLASTPIHLAGWSMGGGVVMQYAIDHPQHVASLTLIAPVSPFGFGATHGLDGQLNTDDAAGSGGGVANPEFVKRLAARDRGDEPNLSPRAVMNSYYFKPPFRVAPPVEDRLVDAILLAAVGEDNYPGDMSTSPYWPGVAPGKRGVLNTMAPTYCNLSILAEIDPKPPILWVYGDSDQVVSDFSLFDLAALGQLGAVPGWPGADVCPPQLMIGQMRTLLDRYRANGGSVKEICLADCGHSPHIEKPDEFQHHLRQMLAGE